MNTKVAVKKQTSIADSLIAQAALLEKEQNTASNKQQDLTCMAKDTITNSKADDAMNNAIGNDSRQRVQHFDFLSEETKIIRKNMNPQLLKLRDNKDYKKELDQIDQGYLNTKNATETFYEARYVSVMQSKSFLQAIAHILTGQYETSSKKTTEALREFSLQPPHKQTTIIKAIIEESILRASKDEFELKALKPMLIDKKTFSQFLQYFIANKSKALSASVFQAYRDALPIEVITNDITLSVTEGEAALTAKQLRKKAIHELQNKPVATPIKQKKNVMVTGLTFKEIGSITQGIQKHCKSDSYVYSSIIDMNINFIHCFASMAETLALKEKGFVKHQLQDIAKEFSGINFVSTNRSAIYQNNYAKVTIRQAKAIGKRLKQLENISSSSLSLKESLEAMREMLHTVQFMDDENPWFAKKLAKQQRMMFRSISYMAQNVAQKIPDPNKSVLLDIYKQLHSFKHHKNMDDRSVIVSETHRAMKVAVRISQTLGEMAKELS